MEEAMAHQSHNKYPALKGLLWHCEQYYSFFIPNNWHKFPWSDKRDGVICCPDISDPFTFFAVDLEDLGTLITPNDLDVLAEGLFESIEKLPEFNVESHSQKGTNGLMELETHYSFRERREMRKRWVRVFYHETRQIVMTSQGSNAQTYN